MRTAISLFLTTTFVGVVAGWASAATYLVRPDGGGAFTTIQEAINGVSDFDVIELADGTFRGAGNVDLDFGGKTLTLRSQSGDPGACVIDVEGASTFCGFEFQSGEFSDCRIEGVTITHGNEDGC